MRCPRLNAVINAVESIAPLKLADSSWDNVGLIYETPGHVAADTLMGVMLAIDLTEAIVKQARANNCQLIISYHPPWFRGVKRLTQDVGSEARLVGLAAAAGISLYSPHTATDNAKPGINDCVLDWLGTILATVKPIVPSAFDDGSGAGRIGCFPTPIPLREALKKVSKTFSLPTMRYAIPDGIDLDTKLVQRIGVCVGSGASLLHSHFQSCQEPVDFYLTGEMSHHDLLKCVNEWKCPVALTEHTTMERAIFYGPFLTQLRAALKDTGAVLNIPTDDADPVKFFHNSF